MKVSGNDSRDRQSMRPWTIRDIDDETRKLVIRAAKREGMTISQWVNRVLDEQAHGTLNPARSMKGCSQVPGRILDELRTLNRRLDRVERRTAIDDDQD
ncbi:MAG: hypothetical protein HQL76_16280 [Magnetococcales bacterium]|nr:hypothetical protein [Magnetococcales bacterium]